MEILYYDRQAAADYAKKWAFRRNPAFYDYSNIGGDCTNFASQCIYAGAGVMNFTPVYGWYYRNANDKSASWTGVEYLYNFLTENTGAGPFAERAELSKTEIGDIIQLGSATGDFYHSPVVVGVRRNGQTINYGDIFVAAHTYDTYYRPLSSYNFAAARLIHILGVRRT